MLGIDLSEAAVPISMRRNAPNFFARERYWIMTESRSLQIFCHDTAANTSLPSSSCVSLCLKTCCRLRPSLDTWLAACISSPPLVSALEALRETACAAKEVEFGGRGLDWDNDKGCEQRNEAESNPCKKAVGEGRAAQLRFVVLSLTGPAINHAIAVGGERVRPSRLAGDSAMRDGRGRDHA